MSPAQYTKWLDALTPTLKAKVLKDWGAPGASRLMTSDGALVIPAVRFGKIMAAIIMALMRETDYKKAADHAFALLEAVQKR